MGFDKDKIIKRRSKEAKALERKQYRPKVIGSKKRERLARERDRDGSERLPELGVGHDEPVDEGDGISGYAGLGFAGTWSGSGGDPGAGGEEPEEGNSS